MILSIITINRNNAEGLRKTLQSVVLQEWTDFEFIVIDGASDDGSIEIICDYAKRYCNRIKWVSEPDTGIYNAMNKGIKMASGDYLQFLNSGDCLNSNRVTGLMIDALKQEQYPTILYGNLLKDMPDGRIIRDRCFAGQDCSLLGFFTGSLNHSSTYISKDLFSKYGLYDENLKIVSDWKWFLKAIILGKEKPVYTNIDVTLFDMGGISETNQELNKVERKKVLEELIPQAILDDYNRWSFPIEQMKRLKRHPWAYKLVWFIERCLFKSEKHHQKRIQEREYR